MSNLATCNLIDRLEQMSKDRGIGLEDRLLVQNSAERMTELLELVDSCYEIIEIFDAQGSQIEWKKNWLEKARKCGASTF